MIPAFCLYETGRVDIKLNIDLPEDTELREPIQEGCIWCQARGTATDVSTADIRGASSEKVETLPSFIQLFITKLCPKLEVSF